MYKLRFSAYLLALYALSAFLVSCTNLNENEEMEKRIDESLSGGLTQQKSVDLVGNSFSFSTLGDVHEGHFRGNHLEEALNEIKTSSDLFTLLLGDIADDGKQSGFLKVQSLFTSLNLKMRAVIGNHDTYFGGWENYKSLFGTSIFHFDVGQVASFFVLDAANGYLGSTQTSWLEDQLRLSGNPVKIVCLHTPIYLGPLRSIWQLASDEEAAKLKYLAKKYGIQLFLAGHYHGYVNYNIDGVLYVVSGGINNQLDAAEPPHYLRITVDTSQNIQIEKHNL